MSRLKPILTIALMLLFVGCKTRKNEKKSEQMPPLRIEVTTATLEHLCDRISSTSQIKGINSAIIQPRISGYLTSINYRGGMPIKRGELMFVVDPSNYATELYAAKAAVESARAEEALAQRNFERAAPLAQIDAISQSDLDQYRASYKSAVASTKSAEENLRLSQLELGYTKIYAPISGVASKSTASIGDYIGLSTLQNSLATITQLDTVTVEIAIPTARYLTYIAQDDNSLDNSTLLSQIELTLPDSSIYNYTGQYYYTLKDTPSRSSTVVIVAKFPNPSLQLKEGMFARIGANIGTMQPRIVVPKSAVSQMQGINSVWVIAPDSTAQWREVTLGKTYGSLWAIDQGVEEGERVVIGGAAKLHKGEKVAAVMTNK